MANYEKEIYELGQVQLAYRSNLAELSEKKQQEAFNWFNVGSGYYHEYFKEAKKINAYYEKINASIEKVNQQNRNINAETEKINATQGLWPVYQIEDKAVNANNFQERLSEGEIQEIIDFYNWRSNLPEEPEEPDREEKKEEEEKDEEAPSEEDEEEVKKKALEEEEKEKAKTPEPEKGPAPAKEDSTVPAELETLVYQYQQAKANELEADPVHSVANDVKRALNVRNIRHQAELRREARLAKLQGPERERQREIEDLEKDAYLVKTINPKAESASVISQNIERVSRQAIMAEVAIIQKENPNIVITTAQINRAVEELKYYSFTGANLTEYKHLSLNSQLALADQGVVFDPEINDIISKGNSLNQALNTNRFSDEPDQIQEQINLLSDEIQKKQDTHTKEFVLEINNINIDIDVNLEKAQKEQSAILGGLIKIIPNPRSPVEIKPSPLSLHEKELEAALRLSDTTTLISPEGLGSRTTAVLQKTNSDSRNISPEALRLYSLGLTPDKLEKIVSDSKSPLSVYFQSPVGKTVYQQVHFQLKKIHDSKLGQDVAGNIKPLTGISNTLTVFYNKQSPAIQAVTKFAINPRGTAYAWINKKIGQRIGAQLAKNAGYLSQKLGNYLLNEGLSQGVKSFAKAAAEKLALEAAKKIGIAVVGDSLVATVALALGVPTAGASLIIGAVLIVGQVVVDATIGFGKKRLDEIWRSLGWGDKFRSRDLVAPVLLLGAAAATAGAAAFSGLVFLARTAQVAVVSVVGIVIGSVVAAGLYVGFAYMVAPVLSTLVQFDAVERVNYPPYDTSATSSSDCAWPTTGHYVISTGPRGGTHSLSQLEAIDIGAPDGSLHLSATSGTVEFTGVYSNYGNTVKINSHTSAGQTLLVYGHLSEISVSKGQQVTQGQKIGLVGDTGGWSPHIHMEHQGIKYNECPAGGLKIKEECCTGYTGVNCHGTCDAFSN